MSKKHVLRLLLIISKSKRVQTWVTTLLVNVANSPRRSDFFLNSLL